eukprot:TRINITY_DN1350_c0_g1_i2.p1 TRINITY_DN1350_c0_g1~~TRINITY_DN1350_c0_g1_i2.p1  ORF type:complete len:176 (+),score=29.37 TRINITY_DN1350_c0_g1_i2:444-971(+)
MGQKQCVSSQIQLAMERSVEALGPQQMHKLRQDWNMKCGAAGASFDQYKTLMPSLDEYKLQQLFQMYDLNHDMTVQWGEYICCVTVICKGTVDQKLTMIFNAFDYNLDQQVSKKEFEIIVAKFCAPLHEFTPQQRKEFIDNAFNNVRFMFQNTLLFDFTSPKGRMLRKTRESMLV